MILPKALLRLYGVGAGLILVGAFGCAHRPEGPPIPADSPLAQITHDMAQADVEARLGPPTSANAYVSAKAFTPFNYGGDSGAMWEAHYKGLGHVVYNIERYSGQRKVDEVVYDPSDPGHDQ